MTKELDDFIQMVKEGRFADAHMVLEHPWKAIKNENRGEGNILKGLINGTTAFELKRRGKDDGALRVWATFIKYKPLIDTVHSSYRQKYKECAEVLEERYAELQMKQ